MFLNSNGEYGPCVPVQIFIGVLPQIKTPAFTDASGWEVKDNPKPGTHGCIWWPKYLKHSQCIAMSIGFPELRKAMISMARKSINIPKQPTIAYLELFSLCIMVLWFVLVRPSVIRGKCLIIKVDNTNVISWSTKGRMKFRPYNFLLKLLCTCELALKCKFKVIYINTKQNRIADSLTRELADADYLHLPNRSFPLKIVKPDDKIIRCLAITLSEPECVINADFFKKLFMVLFPSVVLCCCTISRSTLYFYA